MPAKATAKIVSDFNAIRHATPMEPYRIHVQHVAPAVTGHTINRCDITAAREPGQLANVKGGKASCATVHDLRQGSGKMIAEGATEVPHGRCSTNLLQPPDDTAAAVTTGNDDQTTKILPEAGLEPAREINPTGF